MPVVLVTGLSPAALHSALKSTLRARICQPTRARGSFAMAMANPLQFIQQVRSEVAKVVWPTRREVLLTTVMVFIMAALTATFFSLVDMVIRFGLSAVLNSFG